MTIPLSRTIRLILLAAVVSSCTATSHAQASLDELGRFLRERAAFSEDDFSALRKGEIIVKRLGVTEKREVAVIGAVRMQASAEQVLQAFRASMRQANDNSLLAVGKFSSVPNLDDLQNLKLDHRDVEDLKLCVVGKCKLKLSAAMMERFQKEVDWNAPGYQDQATRLFREMLLDYVRDYQARGDAALIEYHDQQRSVSVREEQQALLERVLYVNDFAPELASYFRKFPTSERGNIETGLSWTKIKFGLKPVIIITHQSTFSRSHGDTAQQIVSVAKQIYANHYFDSSLAVTAIINIPASAEASDAYLLYTNHSRADSLGGAVSRLKRGLVESEAVENLNELLQKTRTNVDLISINQSHAPVQSGKEKAIDWLLGGTRVLWLLIGLLTVLAFVWISKYQYLRMRRR
ncbi:MAG TPA: hypothetical protein VI750_10435 [Pyrinomonadaceae bacterium]|nr:hypothetical protein [Pyrinomonadaceae bacterium]